MRKMRKELTFLEWYDWAENRWVDEDISFRSSAKFISDEMKSEEAQMHLPDSFYEDSPIGSFGKFLSDYSDTGHYDYLAEIHGRKYTDSHGFVWSNFTPGLPTDVDACGMPK